MNDPGCTLVMWYWWAPFYGPGGTIIKMLHL